MTLPTGDKLKIMMVNIGFLPNSLGGTEVYTYNLTKELLSHGHEVIVVTALNDLAYEQYQVIESEFEQIRVINIVNSPFFARSYLDYFLNPNIDKIFDDLLEQEAPDLIHFQHLAYLSGNLPQVAHQKNIPSVSTIHDYWYLCFRSQLIRPDGSICSGPGDGLNCATCDDGKSPNPTAVPRYPEIVQYINTPKVKHQIERALEYIPINAIHKARSILFKSLNGGKKSASNPEITHLLQNQFRVDHFKKQFALHDLIISPSEHLKNRYEREGYPDIKVVPLGFHGVEAIEALPFTGTLKFSFIGNLAKHKGLHVVLTELLALAEDGHKFELNVYGHTNDSIYMAFLKRLAKKFPPDYVVFHGPYQGKSDLVKIFSNTHMTFFPSVWEENHPLVIREAMLYGVPVIASNLGGVCEIIEDQKNGLIFNPFEKGSLAQVVLQLIQNPSSLELLRSGAKNTKIESMADHVNEIQSIYSKIYRAHKVR